jgi:hypothetical protein
MSDITAPELRVEDTIVDGQANVASAANDEMAKKIAEIDEKISKAIEDLAAARDARIFPLFLDRAAITDETVEDVFEDLREKYKIGIAGCCDRLDVVLESGGGSIDAAYNIGLLLRRYAAKELNIIIPRWAKSAATVIACAGDEILMTPIAELGPVDPQITMFNPLEVSGKRLLNSRILHRYRRGPQDRTQGRDVAGRANRSGMEIAKAEARKNRN